MLVLAGCASSQFTPSMVSGNKLENASVGFSGISLTFPNGYEAETFVSEDQAPKSFGQTAWVSANHIDQKFGTQLEHVAFGTKTSGISVSILQIPHQLGPRIDDEFIQQRVMEEAARKFILSGGSDAKRSVRKIGSHYTACVSRMNIKGNTYKSVREVILRPSYLLIFIGACPAGIEAQLDTDLDSVVASLRPTKN